MSDDDHKDDDSKLVTALQWVMDIDPAGVIADVKKKQTAHEGEDGRALAQRFVASYARKAGAEGSCQGSARTRSSCSALPWATWPSCCGSTPT